MDLDTRKIVTLEEKSISFRTPNEITEWRVDNFLAVEPITLAWILGFERDEILVDVGANFGVFALTAAIVRKARVFAFEPQSQNFALLHQNIVDNDLADLVKAWPLALSDEQKIGELHVMGFGAGNANHAFGEAKNFHLHDQKFPHSQGSVSTTLDILVADGVIPVPDHIKIDVDGFEYKVIAGGETLLAEPQVKSVLIELNLSLAPHQDIVDKLQAWGFEYDLELALSCIRTEGIHKGTGEIVFYRSSVER